MKAILEFNLPDDTLEYKMVNNASSMHSTLWEFDQWLRNELKYNVDYKDLIQTKTLETCREKLHEFMDDNDIKFD